MLLIFAKDPARGCVDDGAQRMLGPPDLDQAPRLTFGSLSPGTFLDQVLFQPDNGSLRQQDLQPLRRPAHRPKCLLSLCGSRARTQQLLRDPLIQLSVRLRQRCSHLAVAGFARREPLQALCLESLSHPQVAALPAACQVAPGACNKQ